MKIRIDRNGRVTDVTIANELVLLLRNEKSMLGDAGCGSNGDCGCNGGGFSNQGYGGCAG